MIPFIEHILAVGPLLCISFGGGGGSSQSNPETTTNTTSGASSPVANKDSQAIGSGSIGVSGAGAKYVEQGGTDASGANVGGVGGSINATSGSTVNIGDPNAGSVITDLASKFADTVQSVSASQASGAAAGQSTPLSWSIQKIGLVIAGITAVILAIKFVFGGKKP